MSSEQKLSLDSFGENQLTAFVNELYAIFLKREADLGGLQTYVSALKSGQPLAPMLSVFATSEEFKANAKREAIVELARGWSRNASALKDSTAERPGEELWNPNAAFPEDYSPPGEAGRSYLTRLRSGFLHRYCSGPLVLDVGYSGYDNPEGKAALPHAIGVDLDYPGYDGIRLPFDDGTVDTVFSSHCLEHILFDHAAIQDWYRVLKIGGFIVCMVPSQALYEKRRFLPSRYNGDHKRMYTPSSLANSFETALKVNSYRVRHLAENDMNFDYSRGPELHSNGAYEIEIVLEKIVSPDWDLD